MAKKHDGFMVKRGETPRYTWETERFESGTDRSVSYAIVYTSKMDGEQTADHFATVTEMIAALPTA